MPGDEHASVVPLQEAEDDADDDRPTMTPATRILRRDDRAKGSFQVASWQEDAYAESRAGKG